VAIYLCTWRGTVGGGDIWQAGWHAQSDADVFQVATLVAAETPGLVTSIFPASSTWQGVRVAEINEANGDTVAVAEAALTGISYSSNGALPAEVAECVTIRPVTGLTTGRFYLPPIDNTSCTLAGQMTSTAQTTLADRLQTFFQTDLGGASSPLRLGIYSRKTHNYVGATSVQVGNVYDSQRRRRNKLVESRTTRSVL